MNLFFHPDGTAACLHGEEIPLQALGTLSTRRASTIEFCNAHQAWEVHLIERDGRPGPYVFSSPSRDTCLEWERTYFDNNPQLISPCATNSPSSSPA